MDTINRFEICMTGSLRRALIQEARDRGIAVRELIVRLTATGLGLDPDKSMPPRRPPGRKPRLARRP